MKQDLDLEAALHRALRRHEAPAGFESRVLARTGIRRQQSVVRTWMAIAAMLVAIALAGESLHHYAVQRDAETQKVEAQKAGRELVLALKITSAKLHATHRLIRRRSNGA